MEPTNLLYLQDHSLLTCSATVVAVNEFEGQTALQLDQTVFYPQGGGQPADNGEITGEGVTFNVSKVRLDENGLVWHFGQFVKGTLKASDAVTCSVNPEKRLLHSKIHSAGHVIDMAATQLGLNWQPGKGFHFPEGPYIEYFGTFDPAQKEALQQQIEAKANQLVQQNLPVKVIFVSKADMPQYCHFVPENLPTNKPSRVVLFDTYGIPCGGTHVAALGEIKKITIRKMKQSGDIIKLGYDVERA